METFLLFIIAILGAFCAYFFGKNSNIEMLVPLYKEMVSNTKEWGIIGMQKEAVASELKYLKRIRQLENRIYSQPGRETYEPEWEIVNDSQDLDRELEPEEIALLLPQAQKTALPIRSEIAANSQPIRSQFAANSLPIRSNEPNKADLTPTVVEKGRVSIKNPKEGDRFFNTYKLEKQPLAEVLTFYKKHEAGFTRVFDVPIYELEGSKGKPHKPQPNYPYILLCKWDQCNNVIITTAHNAKECGCKDCAKI